jgi:hypothetical protein
MSVYGEECYLGVNREVLEEDKTCPKNSAIFHQVCSLFIFSYSNALENQICPIKHASLNSLL